MYSRNLCANCRTRHHSRKRKASPQDWIIKHPSGRVLGTYNEADATWAVTKFLKDQGLDASPAGPQGALEVSVRTKIPLAKFVLVEGKQAGYERKVMITMGR